MRQNGVYDAAVIGGGLAGLALSILLAKQGRKVVLFEKDTYPFHKVCGEYISMESWGFLQSLGLDLDKMDLPKINEVLLSAPNGKIFETQLPLGGFGISRFLLDQKLATIAKLQGVEMYEATKVENVLLKQENFILNFSGEKKGSIMARLCFGAFGKRSNLDVRWKRSFLPTKNKKSQNYVGVKYHVRTDAAPNKIALHNFENGYCGFSKIEGDKYCLCYMTSADNLRNCNNSIASLEKNILFKNPHLKKLFSEIEVIASFPVAISQINFTAKKPVENKVMMLGDAAGTIPPLCGNGMSMALHSSKLAAKFAIDFLEGVITRQSMEDQYRAAYKKQFGSRLKAGQLLQQFFGKPLLTNWFLALVRSVPFLAKPIIKSTHGQPY